MPEGTQANPLVRAVFSLGIIVLLSAMLALVLFLGAVPVALIGSGGYLLATTLIPVIAEGIPFAATTNFIAGCALAGGGIIILPFIIYICKAVVKSMRPLADMLNAAAKKKIFFTQAIKRSLLSIIHALRRTMANLGGTVSSGG